VLGQPFERNFHVYRRGTGFPLFIGESTLPYIVVRCRGESDARKAVRAHFPKRRPFEVKKLPTGALEMLRGSWRFA
jgi:hypothetical protein